jgi:predicted NAD-dependent protein-ADP-ribosyltransferase YbiA (DUF1768 family)/endonuclease/exonuclease/phosphatase family metal-dependent hydrolase
MKSIIGKCRLVASSAGRGLALTWALGFAAVASAQTETLRVATYNIEADIDGVTAPRSGMYQVVEGIGEQSINGNAQPLDILALEETTSNSITVAPIVSNLNTFYSGSAVYAQSTVQGGQSGTNASGNGPNAIIYNTKTLQLLASVGVGTPKGSTNGEYRQVMRYEFEPVGGSASNIFYVYVTHMKSSASGALFTNESLRNQEAAIIRNDEATLSTAGDPNPRVLYMGDFNLSGSAPVTSGTQSVSAFQTMAADAPSSQGKAIDPLNPQNSMQTWDTNATYNSIMSESSTSVRYRDDLQLMTQSVYSGGGPFALRYLPGTLHSFGNNGSVGLFGNVNSSANTALDNLVPNAPVSKSTLLAALTTGSDHMPVVADYSILLPLVGDMNLDGTRTSADVATMLSALQDLGSYKTAYSLSNSDLLSIGDINGDHVVDNADVQSLLGLLQSGSGATAVPEPTTLSLLTVALALMLLLGCNGAKDSRPAVSQTPNAAANATALPADETIQRDAKYPARWWTPVSKEGAPSWEIFPQEAGPGEVILSKRQKDLGLLSNFAPTPFEFHGKKYASLEGFWQAMKFPEGPDDPRAEFPGLKWDLTRQQVEQMTAFEANKAGDRGNENMKKMGITWVTFEGRQMEYKPAEPGEHYKLIVAATWEKVKQNPDVKAALLSTGDLVLKPDHHQEADAPAAWKYFDILMDIRRQLQAEQEKSK